MYKKLTLLVLIAFSFSLSVSAQGTYKPNNNSPQQSTQFTHPKKDKKNKILKVYPVPATTQLTFQLKKHNNDNVYEIIVYNFLGKTVEKIRDFSDRKTIDLNNYYSGIYIYQLLTKKGHLVESGKFNVVKQ